MKKHMLILILIVAMFFSFLSCGKEIAPKKSEKNFVSDNMGDTNDGDDLDQGPLGIPITFDQMYIGSIFGGPDEKVLPIRSKEEAYVEGRVEYAHEYDELVGESLLPGLKHIAKLYDESFYEEYFMLWILNPEDSSSVQYEVEKVEVIERKLVVSITKWQPDFFSEDVVWQPLVLMLPKSCDVYEIESIQTVYTNKNASRGEINEKRAAYLQKYNELAGTLE